MAVIELIVPNLAATSAGNSVTADRYEKLFNAVGHATTSVAQPSGNADVVVALNAYRSASTISALDGDVPLVVVLTGTDIYRFIDEDPARVRSSLNRADRLVGLNDCVGDVLTSEDRAKLTVIKEGAIRGLPRQPNPEGFEVVVVGHLRDEKDPKLVAEAVAGLGPESTVQVQHYGDAYTDEWAGWARDETASNPRWSWQGVRPRHEIDEVYATSRLLINSSRVEGGANVISEAVAASLPILASEIPGNVGVLGPTYPGYFTPGDAAALRAELHRISTNHSRLAELVAAVESLQPEFTEEREQQHWAGLLAELDTGR